MPFKALLTGNGVETRRGRARAAMRGIPFGVSPSVAAALHGMDRRGFRRAVRMLP